MFGVFCWYLHSSDMFRCYVRNRNHRNWWNHSLSSKFGRGLLQACRLLGRLSHAQVPGVGTSWKLHLATLGAPQGLAKSSSLWATPTASASSFFWEPRRWNFWSSTTTSFVFFWFQKLGTWQSSRKSSFINSEKIARNRMKPVSFVEVPASVIFRLDLGGCIPEKLYQGYFWPYFLW